MQIVLGNLKVLIPKLCVITYGHRKATAHPEECWVVAKVRGLGTRPVRPEVYGQTTAGRSFLASDDVMHVRYSRKHSLAQQLLFSYHSKTFSMKKAVHRIAFQYISPPGNSSKTSTLKSTDCSGMKTKLVLEISVTAIKYFLSVGLCFYMFKTEMAEVHLPSHFITGDAKF